MGYKTNQKSQDTGVMVCKLH